MSATATREPTELPPALATRVKVDGGGCWLWTGATNGVGYGRLGRQYVHRLSYTHFVGEIPDGLQLDHLCRVPLCCNPDHLEPVTIGENVRRGLAPIITRLRHAARTHCRVGHVLTPENTYVRPGDRARICRECQRLLDREWKRAHRKSRARTT